MYLQKINLKNKYALVTGAGKGLSRACSIALAEAGATVIALSRTSSDLNRLEKDIKKIKGKVIKVPCDVMNYEDLKAKLEKIKIIDILVNNAGTNIPEPFEKIKQKSMNYLVDLNLKAAFNVAQLVVKKMLKNKKRPGSIINMSSACSSVIGAPNRFVYGTTKAAVLCLTKSVAIDYITKWIRCNAICPGTVERPSLHDRLHATGDYEAAMKAFIARQPMGRIAKAEEIAALVVYLASDESAFTTGQAHIIDGGWSG